MEQEPKTKTQIDRFREMAKQLECDEDEAAFRDKLRVIAKQKPKEEPKQKHTIKSK